MDNNGNLNWSRRRPPAARPRVLSIGAIRCSRAGNGLISPSTAPLPGPALLVTGGIHGSEYVSIDAAIRLGAAIDPKTLRGQILCLPVMNPAAFWERAAYVVPIDNLNLNRVFPGKAKGSFTERLAYQLVQKAMRHADAYIDLHGGDVPEALVPFNIYYETGDAKLDGKSRAMAEAFGAPAMLLHRASGAPIAGLAYATAAAMGIPAMLAEDGGAGQYDAATASRMHDGLQNVLRVLDMIPGGARNMPAPRRFEKFDWVRTKGPGFFRGTVKVGDEVKVGPGSGHAGGFLWPAPGRDQGPDQGPDPVHGGKPGDVEGWPHLRHRRRGRLEQDRQAATRSAGR